MASNPPTQLQTNPAGNGQVKPFRDKLEDFRGLLTRMGPQLSAALPRHMKADRMMRVAMTALQRTPKLLECEPKSFLLCVLQCAQLGLEPDGLLGQAYLIPFNERRNGRVVCTLVVGYKGLLKLARNSGEIASIEAHVVRVGDDFAYRFGTKSFLRHHPADAPLAERKDSPGVMEPDPTWMPGPVTHVYAVAKLKDGTSQFEVMPTYEINWIRDASQGYLYAVDNKRDDNPWMSHWPEMAKKTVIRRFTKMLPASVELQTAAALDEQADLGLPQMFQDAIDVTGTPTEEAAALPAAASAANGTANGAGAPAANGAAKSKLDQLAEQAEGKKEGGS